MTRRVCEYHWERTFRQTLCLRALAANLCSSSSCLESDLSCKIGQTMGFSAKLCVSKWRSFVSCHSCSRGGFFHQQLVNWTRFSLPDKTASTRGLTHDRRCPAEIQRDTGG